jgi:hypothetical protein
VSGVLSGTDVHCFWPPGVWNTLGDPRANLGVDDAHEWFHLGIFSPMIYALWIGSDCNVGRSIAKLVWVWYYSS